MMPGSWLRSASSPPSSACKSAGMQANAVPVRSSGHHPPAEQSSTLGEARVSGRDAAMGSFRWVVTLDNILDFARWRGEDERLGNLKGRFKRSRGTSERSEESDEEVGQ